MNLRPYPLPQEEPLDPSELSFPKVAVLGLAEDAIALCVCYCSSAVPVPAINQLSLRPV